MYMAVCMYGYGQPAYVDLLPAHLSQYGERSVLQQVGIQLIIISFLHDSIPHHPAILQ